MLRPLESRRQGWWWAPPSCSVDATASAERRCVWYDAPVGEEHEKAAKAMFLTNSVIDAQATIRALDFKGYVLLLLLTLPFTKMELMAPAIASLWSTARPLLRCSSVILTLIGTVGWIFALVFALMALGAVRDPTAHVALDDKKDGSYRASGIFFAAKEFSFSFWTALFGDSSVRSATSPGAFAAKLPNADQLQQEMAYEHLKLGFILARKLACTRYGMSAASGWLVCGVALWACWVIQRWL
jgi:hypothetical protein